MTAHKWQFSSRFRRHAFGWRSDAPIQRIKEALAEIKKVSRINRVLAAQGAVSFLEKLSPALEHVDSSSGAVGTAVNNAIRMLVSIITGADVEAKVRQAWLERLWEALQNDDIPYIESLGEYWGELCVMPELAAHWADKFLPLIQHTWSLPSGQRGYFKGETVCLASLHAAGRYDELLTLLDNSPYTWWHYRRWGVKALVALGKKSEAIRYAEATHGFNEPVGAIAQACEAILLSSGMADEAYRRYAVKANQGTTNLSTFRAIAKKYPNIPAEQILRDLVTSQPGSEGKWFAAAKSVGLFDLAIELATMSSTDPRTLMRAAQDYCTTRPDFSFAAGLSALHWIAQGKGYEITGAEVIETYLAVMNAASGAGIDERQAKVRIEGAISCENSKVGFVHTTLARRLLA